MVTTIQISDRTKRMLRNIQERTGQSYNQIIRELVMETEGIPETLFGKYPELPERPPKGS